jgi:hypothetical protein
MKKKHAAAAGPRRAGALGRAGARPAASRHAAKRPRAEDADEFALDAVRGARREGVAAAAPARSR